MSEFHQHPDNWVYVRTPSGTYADTPENFELDSDASLPELPEGADERLYVPGVKHAINNRFSTIAGGPLEWEFGDQAISNIEDLLAAKAIREEDAED